MNLRYRLASAANSVVIGVFALEKKMHYPVMTEKQLATRWKISVKTLQRWRLDMVGSVWHKLFNLRPKNRVNAGCGVLNAHRCDREQREKIGESDARNAH